MPQMNLNAMPTYVILLVMVGICVAVGATITTSLQENKITVATGTVTDELITLSNETAVALSINPITAVTSVMQGSDTIEDGNYTVDASAGTIILINEEATVTNEAITLSNTTPSQLENAPINSLTSVVQSGVTIGSGNYTVNLTAGTIVLKSGAGPAAYTGDANATYKHPINNYDGEDANVTYTYPYNVYGVGYYEAGNATAGISQLGTMLPIIGIIIGAAFVIVLLFSAFFKQGERR
jgi:hypothetical protein